MALKLVVLDTVTAHGFEQDVDEVEGNVPFVV
jgi:hypothetical protein